jgi:hypothetical protein
MLGMTAMGTEGMMARISYVDPGKVTEPALAGYLAKQMSRALAEVSHWHTRTAGHRPEG